MSHSNVNVDMHVIPHLNGVQLSRQPQKSFYPTLVEILRFPCNVYFLNTQSAIQNINDYSASSSGFYSVEDAIGRTVFDVLTIDNACAITNVDREVLRKKRAKINDDLMVRNDGYSMNFLTVKVPVYNDNNKVTGVFGCSVLLNEQPLADSLMLMSKIGMLSSIGGDKLKYYVKNKKIDGVYLTGRQAEIIHYYVRGWNARQIGEILSLSRRTVEHYIENIKQKLNVNSKIQLFEKIMHFDNDQ